MSEPMQALERIDTAQIPEFRAEELAKGALDLLHQAFSMPGAEERYQAWLKERRAKESLALTIRAEKEPSLML